MMVSNRKKAFDADLGIFILLIIYLGLPFLSCGGKTGPVVCRSHQSEVWRAALVYFREHHLTTKDLIDPRQLALYFPDGQVPRCPEGTNPYAPFKILAGPQCPYQPELHAGKRVPTDLVSLTNK